MKRFISAFLAFCLALTALAAGFVTVSAEGNQIEDTDIVWNFNAGTGELRFEGEGAIPDYEKAGLLAQPSYPWKGINYKSIVFGEGITGIGNYAFQSSGTLKSVVIPDTVTVLGKGVFYKCENLESATLPSEVTAVSEEMFSMCEDLDTVIFGNKTEAIGTKAFYKCTALNSVTLPATLKTIGTSAFELCDKLAEMNVPEGVTAIGNRAFDGCEALEKITLPSTLEAIGVSAFNECSSLDNVVIPEKVKVIPSEAFYNCNALASVTLPEGLVEIQDKAFYLCTSLVNVTIPASVIKFGTKAIGFGKAGAAIKDFTVKGYQNSYARLYAEANKFTFDSLGYILNGKCGETAEWEYNEEEKTLYIKGTGIMYDYTADALALYNLIDYEKVVISEEITKIGAYAFYGAAAMEFELSGNLTEIGEKAIGYYADDKGEAKLREGVSIKAYADTAAHAYAKDNSITFNEILVTEGSLGESITWSYDVVTKMLVVSGTGATYDYTADKLATYADYEISAIVIGDGITAIGDYVFATTKAYPDIMVGKDVMSIGDNAFGFTKTFIRDEEGNPTDEVVFMANEDLVVKGYLVTPADEYSKEYMFNFEALDGDVYPEFTTNLPSITDHINKIIYIYASDVKTEDFIIDVADESITATVPEKIATKSIITFTRGEASEDYTVIIPGDLTGDGVINSTDALRILQHAVDLKPIDDPVLLTAGNIDGKADVNSTDALLILQIAVDKVSITDVYNPGESK